MKSVSFKKLTQTQSNKCYGYIGYGNNFPLTNGQKGLFINKTIKSITLVVACRNCGEFNRLMISKRKLQSILKQL